MPELYRELHGYGTPVLAGAVHCSSSWHLSSELSLPTGVHRYVYSLSLLDGSTLTLAMLPATAYSDGSCTTRVADIGAHPEHSNAPLFGINSCISTGAPLVAFSVDLCE